VCGRFTLRARAEDVAEHFELDATPELQPRFNIAPGQDVAVVRSAEGAQRTLERRIWGLVPSWARDPAIGHRMINARSETVAEKPAFRGAFAGRRCLIPADGFYEWAVGSTPKQPYWIARADEGLFAFAGLFEEWHAEASDAIHSCSIVTTAANGTLAPIHHRMPVILGPEDYATWLGDDADRANERSALMRPCPDDWLRARPVGLRVNSPRHDGPECLAPAPMQPVQGSLL